MKRSARRLGAVATILAIGVAGLAVLSLRRWCAPAGGAADSAATAAASSAGTAERPLLPDRKELDPAAVAHAADGAYEALGLEPGPGRIGGIVVDDAAEPIPGAEVSLTCTSADLGEGAPRRPRFDASVRSDRDGRFVFADLPAARFAVTAEQTGGRGTHVEGVTPDADLVLTTARRVSVTVLVRAPGGSPVPGATVGHHDERDGASSEYVLWRDPSVTDADGAVVLELLGGHHYLVGARADGWVEATTRAAIDARAPPTVVLALTAGLAIAGRVVDAAGRPVAGAKIAELGDVPEVVAAIGRKSAVTDSGGAFRIEGLAEGTYDLSVAPAGEPSVFSLDGAAGPLITLTTCSRRGRPPQPDGEGRPAGPACTPFYMLDVAAGTRGLEIAVPAPGAIDVHASLAAPPPAGTKLTVTVFPERSPATGYAFDSRGTDVVAADLLPGRYLVWGHFGADPRRPALVGDVARVEVRSGETASATLTFMEGATVTGWVVLADGTPGAGVPLALDGAPAMPFTATLTAHTSDDGSFVFSHVPASLYVLRGGLNRTMLLADVPVPAAGALELGEVLLPGATPAP